MRTAVDVFANAILIRLELTPKQLTQFNRDYEFAKQLEEDQIRKAFDNGMFDDAFDDDDNDFSEQSKDYYDMEFDI